MEMEKDDSLLVATFILNGALFGIDAGKVQEVVLIDRITPVHHAPAWVVGVRNLRGKIVTIIDLAAKLELGAVEQTAETRILILKWTREPIGIMVDAVSDAVRFERSTLEAPPPNLHDVQSSDMKGVLHHQGRLVALLNPDSLLHFDERAEAEAGAAHK